MLGNNVINYTDYNGLLEYNDFDTENISEQEKEDGIVGKREIFLGSEVIWTNRYMECNKANKGQKRTVTLIRKYAKARLTIGYFRQANNWLERFVIKHTIGKTFKEVMDKAGSSRLLVKIEVKLYEVKRTMVYVCKCVNKKYLWVLEKGVKETTTETTGWHVDDLILYDGYDPVSQIWKDLKAVIDELLGF